MGLKSQFNKFVKDICPEVYEEIHISEYAYKRVAIDISLYMHKFKAVCGDRWLQAFLNLVSCLRRNEVHCVFIFDGKAPPEKDSEREKRRKERQKMEIQVAELEKALNNYHKTGVLEKCLVDLYKNRRSPSKRLLAKNSDSVDIRWLEEKILQRKNQLYEVNPEDFELAKELFDILNVPYYISPTEAEKMCSKLCMDGKVDAVLSEDTDVIAYKSPVFLSRIDTAKDTCTRLVYDNLLSELKITSQQMTDLCIMCGTDYNPNIPKIGSKTAYKYITKYETIENISSQAGIDMSVLNHVRVRQLFTEFVDFGITNIPYCGKPNFELFEKFASKNNIHANLEKLSRDFVQNTIVFESSDDENTS